MKAMSSPPISSDSACADLSVEVIENRHFGDRKLALTAFGPVQMFRRNQIDSTDLPLLTREWASNESSIGSSCGSRLFELCFASSRRSHGANPIRDSSP